jgi:hypothetical protein
MPIFLIAEYAVDCPVFNNGKEAVKGLAIS